METNIYRQRIALQSTLMNYINQLIVNNGISPSMLEDALNNVLVNLHCAVIEELLVEEDKLNQEEQEVEDGTGVNTDNN